MFAFFYILFYVHQIVASKIYPSQAKSGQHKEICEVEIQTQSTQGMSGIRIVSTKSLREIDNFFTDEDNETGIQIVEQTTEYQSLKEKNIHNKNEGN